MPISEAVRLTKDNYQPSGGTPLLDAVGAAIMATDEVVRQEGGTKVIVVIQTDGQENSSIKYSLSAIKVLIEERQARNWQFVFIGAGINAFADAAKMGINTGSTMSYQASSAGTGSTFRSTGANTKAFVYGSAATMNYSAGQSVDAGEDPIITAQKMKQPKSEPVSSVSLTK
jgi:hypothetical protein